MDVSIIIIATEFIICRTYRLKVFISLVSHSAIMAHAQSDNGKYRFGRRHSLHAMIAITPTA